MWCLWAGSVYTRIGKTPNRIFSDAIVFNFAPIQQVNEPNPIPYGGGFIDAWKYYKIFGVTIHREAAEETLYFNILYNDIAYYFSFMLFTH